MRKTNGEGEQIGRTINTNKVQGKEGQIKNQRSGLGPKGLQKYRQNQPTLEMFPRLLVQYIVYTTHHPTKLFRQVWMPSEVWPETLYLFSR